MNTLVPLSDVNACAEVLEERHLNRLRSDIVQVLKGCCEPAPEPGSEVKEHPAIKMWRGNEPFLIKFGTAVCIEWQSRGNSDATLKKILGFKSDFEESSREQPEWWGNEEVHDSHKSYLLRLKPSHYRRFWPELSDELPMIWPRSPQRSRKSAEQREGDRLYRKAVKAKQRLEGALKEYDEACEAAGLDAQTFEFKDDSEVVTIGVPDPDVIDL